MATQTAATQQTVVTEPSPVEPLIDSNELARRLDVSAATIVRWRAAGMPSHRVGNQWRFAWSDVLAWSKERA